ncbi:MAG: FUSC family protein, partial [Solirubrobacterales bacterium]
APFAAERERIEVEVPAVLRRCAGWLRCGVPGEPGLEPLRSAHADLGRVALAHVGSLTEQGPAAEREAARELDEVFRLRLLAYASTEIAETAQRALGARVDSSLELARDRVEAAGRVARAHASMHSVWLRNSLRAALGLALAVLIAQLADLEHAFWVVLGTMSVLRSSALATSSTIAFALLGSLAGIVVGGLLVVAVDSSEAALWVLLPFATLLAAYSPRAVSFAAGQAGFSVVVLILFNLLEPTGWEVGLARIEDVAIGAGVSLVVGALLWPRGATAVLREAIGSAYERSAAFLDATLAALLGGVAMPPSLAREAFASSQILDANIRDYLSDRSGANAPIEELTVLMAGARRLRQVADLLSHREVLARVSPLGAELPRVERERAALEAERDAICGWYTELAAAVNAAAPAPPPVARQASRPLALERMPGDAGPAPGVAIAWAGRYLDALGELEPALAAANDSMSGSAPA